MVEFRNKRIPVAVLVLVLGGVLPAQAQEAEKKPEKPEQSEATEAPAEAVVNKRETVTGSRISSAVADDERRQGTFAPVDVYSREQLRNTGEIDLGRALRRLDPSIRGN